MRLSTQKSGPFSKAPPPLKRGVFPGNFLSWRPGFRPALLGAFLALCIPAVVVAANEEALKYPFDPACPWGRLSNGKGMFHRCITKEEARRLAEAGGVDGNKREGDDSPGKDPVRDESKPEASPKSYELTVGPIAADNGDIEVGRLGLPTDRYRECIDKNGGLKKSTGKIVVKFLVRAERVRAEGVSVESYENVSAQAAECVAAVVDRRKTGVPSVPLTGARLTFQLKEKK